MSVSERGLWERLQRIDRRIIYTIIIAAELLVIVRPLGLPMIIDAETKLFYNYVQDMPEGSVFVMNLHTSSGAWGEDQSIAEATWYHILSRPIKVIALCIGGEDAAIWSQTTFIAFAETHFPDKVYGVDWVYLGYVPLSEVAFRSFFSDLRETYPSDYKGTDIDALSIMDGIETAADFDIFLQARSTLHDTEYIVRQFVVPYGEPNNIPFIQWDAVFNVPSEMPYRESGQIASLLGAARAGPQYELLIGRPSVGAMMGDMISATHILVILFIILGNLGYFMTRRGK